MLAHSSKRLLLSLLTVFSIVSSSLILSAPTYADCREATLGIPHWYRGLVDKSSCEIDPKKISDGQGLKSGTVTIVLNVAEILTRLAAISAVALIIYSGFVYITSIGISQKVESAKKTLTNAVIGLAISILATVIVNSLFNILRG